MYNTSDIYNRRNLNDLRKKPKINDLAIYSKYIKNFKIGSLISSPFRKDPDPSFSTYTTNAGIRFTDFGRNLNGNVYEFVKILFNLSSISEVYEQINTDFKNDTVSNDVLYFEDTAKSVTDIGIVRQPFTKIDIDYWNSYGISESTLVKFNVFSIKYYICNGKVKGTYSSINPMFAYKVFDTFKIYRPLAKSIIYKWRSNLNNDCLQGWEQLPQTGDILFITKSLKDVMCLYELGYNAVAPSSESVNIPQNKLNELKSRFKRIIVLYDRDRAGVKSARKLVHENKFDFIFLKKENKCKDISDYIKYKSKEYAEKLIRNKLNYN